MSALLFTWRFGKYPGVRSYVRHCWLVFSVLACICTLFLRLNCVISSIATSISSKNNGSMVLSLISILQSQSFVLEWLKYIVGIPPHPLFVKMGSWVVRLYKLEFSLETSIHQKQKQRITFKSHFYCNWVNYLKLLELVDAKLT